MTKKKKCQPQNYQCGGVCIKGVYVCHVDGLTGQSVSIANNLEKLLVSAKNTEKPEKFQDFSSLNELGSGNLSTVYSDGKGNAYKVEDLLRPPRVWPPNRKGLENYRLKKLEIKEDIVDPISEKGYTPKIKDIYITDDNKVVTILEEVEKEFSKLSNLKESEKPTEEDYAEIKSFFKEQGILHKDLHEDNVLFNTKTKEVKVLDLDDAERTNGELSDSELEEDWDIQPLDDEE